MAGIAVVMPVYNAAEKLPLVLPPLLAARERGVVSEIIAVDDSSSDASATLCAEAGVRVLPSGGRRGPGACRNLGVEHVSSPFVLFVDSDVVMHDDAPERILDTFGADPELAAVFGSYDDTPAVRTWVSTYRNLLHHHTHQRGNEDASTFWAGLGAVRTDAFRAVGGFDVERYPRPSIEDIELGYRLRARGGHIRLRKDVLGTHLKQWTLRGMFVTDVFCRALPWARLLNSRAGPGGDLNLTRAEQAKALIGSSLWATLPAIPLWPPLAILTGCLLVLAWAVNRRLFGVVRRRGGVGNMVAAILLHQFYYLYSCAAWLWAKLESVFGRSPGAQAATGPA